MKSILTIAILLLSYSIANAQIGEVKVEGSNAKIYNENGGYTGNSISLCSSCSVAGYNSKYIVIIYGSNAQIYNDQGGNTGNTISLCESCYVKKVTSSAILIKEGGFTKYYNFKGGLIDTKSD